MIPCTLTPPRYSRRNKDQTGISDVNRKYTLAFEFGSNDFENFGFAFRGVVESRSIVQKYLSTFEFEGISDINTAGARCDGVAHYELIRLSYEIDKLI